MVALRTSSGPAPTPCLISVWSGPIPRRTSWGSAPTPCLISVWSGPIPRRTSWGPAPTPCLISVWPGPIPRRISWGPAPPSGLYSLSDLDKVRSYSTKDLSRTSLTHSYTLYLIRTKCPLRTNFTLGFIFPAWYRQIWSYSPDDLLRTSSTVRFILPVWSRHSSALVARRTSWGPVPWWWGRRWWGPWTAPPGDTWCRVRDVDPGSLGSILAGIVARGQAATKPLP